MSVVWNTKYGRRRVRHDPPVLAEAIAAAQGLTDDLEQQAELAAELIGVPVAEAMTEIKKRAGRRQTVTVTSTDRKGFTRAVVVERRPSRVLLGARAARS